MDASAKRERPILFSAPMVRCLLDDRKTQTRRPVKAAPEWAQACHNAGMGGPGGGAWWDFWEQGRAETARVRCPYGVPGDLLWVREEFSGSCVYQGYPPREWLPGTPIWHWADGEPTEGDWTRPKPSIHMPRWTSRITLRITDVRVERLQDISEADALAEGVSWSDRWQAFVVPGVEHPNKDFPVLSRATAREMYAALWDTINGPGEWLGNPWVWAVSFEVVK